MKEQDCTEFANLVVDNVFPPDHWCRDWALENVRDSAYAGKRLLREPNYYPHFLCVYRLGQEGAAMAPACRQMFSASEKLRDEAYLKKVIDPWPRGLIRALKKLGPKALTKRRYDQLIQLLHDPVSAKVIYHRKRIRSRDLKLLVELPEALRDNAVLDALHNDEDVEKVSYLLAAANKLQITGAPELMQNFLRNTRKEEMWAFDIYDDIVQRTEFPPPPWGGDEVIKPISCRSRMRQVGKEFKNCLKHRVREVVLGQAYYYLCLGDEDAVAELVRDPILGWCVRSILLAENRTPPKKLRRALARRFERAGIPKTSMCFLLSY